MDVIARVDDPVAEGPAVGRDRDSDARVPARRNVEDVEPAVLDVDDGPAVRRGPHDVEIVVFRDRGGVLGAELLRVEVGDAVAAVGDEVHQAAGPHRIAVLADIIRDRRIGLGHSVMEPDILVLAPFIALPIIFLVAAAAEEELVLFGDEADEHAPVEGQAHGGAALDSDRIEIGVAADGVLEHRPEDDFGPVGRPGDDLGAAGVVGQPHGRPALGRHDVDGRGAVVARGESEPTAVGRELGGVLGPGECRQAGGDPASGADDPEIRFVGEDDLVVVDGRIGEEAALFGREQGDAQ